MTTYSDMTVSAIQTPGGGYTRVPYSTANNPQVRNAVAQSEQSGYLMPWTGQRTGAGRYPTGITSGYSNTPYGSTGGLYNSYQHSSLPIPFDLSNPTYSSPRTVNSGMGVTQPFTYDYNRSGSGQMGGGAYSSGAGVGGAIGGAAGTETTTSQSTTRTQRDPRSQALYDMLENIISGNREAIDRDRALSAASEAITGASAQQAQGLRQAAAASGASLTDPSFMAAQRGLESRRQTGTAQAARDISMRADEAKLAAQFAAGQMMQAYDPTTQTYSGSKTSPYSGGSASAFAGGTNPSTGLPLQYSSRGTDWQYSAVPGAPVYRLPSGGGGSTQQAQQPGQQGGGTGWQPPATAGTSAGTGTAAAAGSGTASGYDIWGREVSPFGAQDTRDAVITGFDSNGLPIYQTVRR